MRRIFTRSKRLFLVLIKKLICHRMALIVSLLAIFYFIGFTGFVRYVTHEIISKTNIILINKPSTHTSEKEKNMKTFELPNGHTFEDSYPIPVRPIVIGTMDLEFFDPENPIPQEYLEYVKEEYGDVPIYYKKISMYDEEKQQIMFKVYYYIAAVSSDFPKYRPLSFLESERNAYSEPIERIVELTFQCENSKLVVYQKHEITNINLIDLIDICLNDFHRKQLAESDQDGDGYYSLSMYDEAGWESDISIDDFEQLRDYLTSIRLVEEVK